MKKRLLTVALFATLAAPASAQLVYLGEGPTLAEARTEDANLGALTVGIDGTWSETWIAGGANAGGSFGAYFMTDVFVSAPCAGATGEIIFDIFSLPNSDGQNGTQKAKSYSLRPGGFGIFKDVVGMFGQRGGATIAIKVSATRSTTIASCRELAAWGRTYTAAPGGGEYSTGLVPTFTTVSVSSSRYAQVSGVQQNTGKRTNVIVMTPYSSTGTVYLYIYDHTGAALGTKTVTVYGYSATQVSLSEFNIPAPGGVVRAVAPSGSSFRFQAYAVTVDNNTNDGFLNMFAEHDL